MRARLANHFDAASIAQIYNEGIADRTATFETAVRSVDDILAWFDGIHPVVVVVDDDPTTGEGEVLAFARSSEYSPRECYAGVFDFSVYTDRKYRRRGAGALAMRELVTQARASGAWKLVSRLFVENESSRALLAQVGFREVGTYYRHGKLDGRWRDVIVVEKFLAPTGAEGAAGPPVGRPSRENILLALRSDKLETRFQVLVHGRSLIETNARPDPELLNAAAEAFFMAKVHDAATRARFVELFRSYALLTPETSNALYEALFLRLDRWSIATELDAFYEVLFVVRQIARPGDAARVPDLADQVSRLVEWLQQALELPHAMRTRISPGNVASLLLTLALAGCATEEQKKRVASLAAEAKARHHVEPPVSLRAPLRSSSLPPPLPTTRTAPPPLPRPPPLPGTLVVTMPEDVLDLEMAIESVDFLPTDEDRTAADAPMLVEQVPGMAEPSPPVEASLVEAPNTNTKTGKKKRAARPKRTKAKKK